MKSKIQDLIAAFLHSQHFVLPIETQRLKLKNENHENPKNNEKVIKNLKNNQNIVKKRGINGKKFIFISMLNISCDNQMVMDND